MKKNERVSIDFATVFGDILTQLKLIVYLEPEAVITPSVVCPYVWVVGLSITGEA